MASRALCLATLALALPCVPGCRAVKALDLISIPEAKARNLEQLHTPETEHRYSAALTGDVSYLLGRMLTGIGPGKGFEGRQRDPRAVRDPDRRCLGNLLELLEASDADPSVAALQVEWAARLAVQDPWALSREAAVRYLGRAARRLEAGASKGPAVGPTPVGPAELGELLVRLLRTVRADIDAQRRSSADARGLAQLVTEIRALEFDLEGAQRALRTVRLLDAATVRRVDLPALRELSTDLQRRLVHIGLAAALEDRSPRVRAAGWVAAVEAGGMGVLGERLALLEEEPDDLVVATMLRLVAVRGLPQRAEGTSPQEQRELRERWLGQIHFHAVQHPESWVRATAMTTLGRLSGGETVSLREEDWIRWWERRKLADSPPTAATAGAVGG